MVIRYLDTAFCVGARCSNIYNMDYNSSELTATAAAAGAAACPCPCLKAALDSGIEYWTGRHGDEPIPVVQQCVPGLAGHCWAAAAWGSGPWGGQGLARRAMAAAD